MLEILRAECTRGRPEDGVDARGRRLLGTRNGRQGEDGCGENCRSVTHAPGTTGGPRMFQRLNKKAEAPRSARAASWLSGRER